MSDPATIVPTQTYETTISYGNAATNAASSVFTPFAGVIDIKPPKIEAKDIDTTTLTSADQFNEYLPGYANAGEITVTIQYDKAQTGTVYGLFRTPSAYVIEFADGSQWEFDNSYIKGYEDKDIKADSSEVVTTDITIKISGKPNFVPAA